MPQHGSGPFRLATTDSRRLAIGIVLLALAALIVAFGVFFRSGRNLAATSFDIQIHDWVVAQRQHWSRLTQLSLLITQFGDPPVAITSTIVALLGVHWLHRQSIAGIRRSEILVWLGAILGAWLLGVVLKQIFRRERPPIINHLVTETSFSFPSGHSVFAGVFYTTIAILVSRLIPGTRPWLRRVAIALCAGLAVSIALSRVWLGVHYPTDVLAGLLVGSATALGVWLARVGATHANPNDDMGGSGESSQAPGVE